MTDIFLNWFLPLMATVLGFLELTMLGGFVWLLLKESFYETRNEMCNDTPRHCARGPEICECDACKASGLPPRP